MDNIKIATKDLNDIIIGDDVAYIVTLPYSITDYDFEVALTHSNGTPTYFTIDINETDKKVTFSLTDTQTTPLVAGVYDYSFTQIDNTGLRNRLFEGKVKARA